MHCSSIGGNCLARNTTVGISDTNVPSQTTNHIRAAGRKSELEEKLSLFSHSYLTPLQQCLQAALRWGLVYFVFLLNGASNEESRLYLCLQLFFGMISARPSLISHLFKPEFLLTPFDRVSLLRSGVTAQTYRSTNVFTRRNRRARKCLTLSQLRGR